MVQNPQAKRVITAGDVATYVVCPEAWRLKYVGKQKSQRPPEQISGKELRKEWVQNQDLSAKLASYAKTAYLLLLALVIIVFLWDQKRAAHQREDSESSRTIEQEMLQGVDSGR